MPTLTSLSLVAQERNFEQLGIELLQGSASIDNQIAYTFSGTLLDPAKLWIETVSGLTSPTISRRVRFSADSLWQGTNWYRELLHSNDSTGSAWEGTGVLLSKRGSKYYQRLDGEDYLLYDFSLVEGDTFTLASEIADFFDEPKTFVVVNVDSVSLLDGSKHKRLQLRCTNDPDGSWYGINDWIEGIGNTRGLLANRESCTTDAPTNLICYSENETVLYQGPNAQSCWITANTEESEFSSIELYPNPAQTEFFIRSLPGETAYKIYAANGALVRVGETRGSVEDLSLQSGVYSLQLLIGDQPLVRKLVIR